ncbi:Uncharacterized protein FWK35_00012048 [Aphis craccivora]|uniref:Uncharacterized protein n=1 Tax=Aphis craccivora TaxID=307492 RepID=A0A6G0ZD39_APHCR|nr:Uncharacterized protein FWK35_00012048 [Aphis craccivora]
MKIRESKTAEIENRVLTKEEENEVDERETPFENFIQGLHNIDAAMEAMIDNYTDGVENLSQENGFQNKDTSIFDKIKHERKDKIATDDIAVRDRKVSPTTDQIEMPLIDGDDGSHSTEHEMLAKGPLSGIVSGGGGETTTYPPTTGFGGSTLPFGGLPTGIPGAGALPSSSLQGDGGGQSPTLILGGFSAIVMPLRGMNMANMASMLSAGQQLGQMLPKPGGS